MNVLQRPLFRQEGGPVAPNMAQAQPPMPMPDPRAAVQEVEARAAQEAAPVGQMLVQETMAGLDAAETPEQIINALRGNARPMEARYAELASFVGEADAQRTPESVLALVQPTIMMTEQGALDSGIGELIQSMTGDIAMETPEGAPTEMGQGIGSLMMAGARAPETGVGQPPVANFSQGGAVQRFQAGGEASRLQQLYSEMLPVYQGVMGDQGEARRMGQAQVLFDIADRAAAFAAGIDPRTGQSVARLSPAAQLGAAVSGLGGQIGQRVAGMEEQDRALRLAALQAAQGEYSAERAAARAAAASRSGDRALGSLYDIYDAEGNVVQQGVPIATQSEYAALMESIPGGRIAPSRVAGSPELREVGGNLYDVSDPTSPRLVIAGDSGADIREFGGNLVDLSDPANPVVVMQGDPEQDIRTVGGNLVDVTNPAEPRIIYQERPDADIREFGGNLIDISDPANPRVVMPGTPDRDLRTVDGRVVDFTDPANPVVLYESPAEADSAPFINIQTRDGDVVSVRENSDEANDLIREGGTVVSRTGPVRTGPLVDPALMQRYAAGETTPEETATIQDEISQRTRPVFNFDTGQYERPTVTPLILSAEQARRDAGLSTVITLAEAGGPSPEGEERLAQLEEFGGAAFGTGAFFRNLGNAVFALGDAVPAPQTQDAVNAVNALNQDALIAFRELTAGRPAQDAVNQFQRLLPNPAELFGSPRNAASQVQQLINLYNANIAAARDAANSGTASATQRQQLEQAIISSQRMVDAYTALREGILGGTTSGGTVDPAQFRR